MTSHSRQWRRASQVCAILIASQRRFIRYISCMVYRSQNDISNMHHAILQYKQGYPAAAQAFCVWKLRPLMMHRKCCGCASRFWFLNWFTLPYVSAPSTDMSEISYEISLNSTIEFFKIPSVKVHKFSLNISQFLQPAVHTGNGWKVIR